MIWSPFNFWFFRLAAGNETPKSPSQAQKFRDAKIKAIVEDYDNIEPLEYLKKIAHQCGTSFGNTERRQKDDWNFQLFGSNMFSHTIWNKYSTFFILSLT